MYDDQFYYRRAPKPYPMTPQQEKLKKVCQQCGIHKGMSKVELMEKMKTCVGPAMKGDKANAGTGNQPAASQPAPNPKTD